MPALSAAIRPASAPDAEALATLKLATFRETFLDHFAIAYPPADLAAFEQAHYAPAAVAAELADPARNSWIACAGDGRLLGYCQVGRAKLPHPDVRPEDGELYQLYVIRAAQGLGLGTRLLDVALDHLGRARPGPVWLGVWEGNARAQAVYAARGFRQVGSYAFMIGQWQDRDFIYRRD